MKIEKLKDKKILVIGLGVEGVSVLSFLKKIKAKKVEVADIKKTKELSKEAKEALKKTGYKANLGRNYLKNIEEFDLVIKSPGIKPTTKGLEKASRISSAMEIFFANAKGKIIGITGSKGKSTTTTAIYKILKTAGKNVKIIGNIGNPVLNELNTRKTAIKKSTYYVVELSSYQLEHFPYSPDIAVLTSFFPEHLDYHGGFDNYLNAKMNIFKNQKKEDIAIIPDGFKLSFRPKSKILRFGMVRGEHFEFEKKEVASIKDIKLLGHHNLQNLLASVYVAKSLEISNENIEKGLNKMRPLPHRLNFIAQKKGIEYWDDAISTTPDSTIAALEVFSDNMGAIFLGGHDRGLDFKELAQKIIKIKVPVLVFFPKNGKKIWKEIKKIKEKDYKPKIFFAKNMLSAVRFSAQEAPRGTVVLLSTASASFSLWKDYKEQGDDFIKAVKNL